MPCQHAPAHTRSGYQHPVPRPQEDGEAMRVAKTKSSHRLRRIEVHSVKSPAGMLKQSTSLLPLNQIAHFSNFDPAKLSLKHSQEGGDLLWKSRGRIFGIRAVRSNGHASTRLRCLEPLRPELSFCQQTWLGFWLEEVSTSHAKRTNTMFQNPDMPPGRQPVNKTNVTKHSGSCRNSTDKLSTKAPKSGRHPERPGLHPR